MRRKQVWRFYCEHCGKGGQSGGHIAKHEKHCLKNPERECRMCRVLDEPQQPLAMLKEALGSADAAGLANIQALTSCPVCISAAIMQTGGYLRDRGDTWTYYDGSQVHTDTLVEYDYKAATAAIWDDINSRERDEAEWSAMHYRGY